MNNLYPQIVKLLREHGCTFKRQGKGSHEIWVTSAGVSFTVAVTCNSHNTANAIMKQAGIAHRF